MSGLKPRPTHTYPSKWALLVRWPSTGPSDPCSQSAASTKLDLLARYIHDAAYLSHFRRIICRYFVCRAYGGTGSIQRQQLHQGPELVHAVNAAGAGAFADRSRGANHLADQFGAGFPDGRGSECMRLRRRPRRERAGAQTGARGDQPGAGEERGCARQTGQPLPLRCPAPADGLGPGYFAIYFSVALFDPAAGD